MSDPVKKKVLIRATRICVGFSIYFLLSCKLHSTYTVCNVGGLEGSFSLRIVIRLSAETVLACVITGQWAAYPAKTLTIEAH